MFFFKSKLSRNVTLRLLNLMSDGILMSNESVGRNNFCYRIQNLIRYIFYRVKMLYKVIDMRIIEVIDRQKWLLRTTLKSFLTIEIVLVFFRNFPFEIIKHNM